MNSKSDWPVRNTGSKKLLAYLGSLAAVFFTLRAEEIRIDEKLSGWTGNHAPSVTFDSVCKVSPKGSILLTADKNKPALDVKYALDLAPNRKYVISFMAKGENITDQRTGAFYQGSRKWDRMTRWSGTFDWTKFTCQLDPGKVGGEGKVSVHFSLFGNTGKLWIDRVKIVPEDAETENRYTISFYPVDSEDNCMTICENLPVIVQLLARSQVRLKEHYRYKTSRLTLDLPIYLKLMGSRSGKLTTWHPVYNTVNPVTEDRTFVRDGIEYRRYFVDYPRFLALLMCVAVPDYHLLFEAAPGSGGKTAKVYWSFDIEGEKTPEQSFTLKVLPPVGMTEPPCGEFRLSIYRQYVINHSGISKAGYDQTVKFWSSLAKSNVYILPDPANYMKKFYGDKVEVLLMYNDCGTPLNAAELAKLRKIMPLTVSLQGEKKNSVSAWALLDDPDRHFEKYLRNTMRIVKQQKPRVDIVVWDTEPFGFRQDGCDEGGRRRFAEKMKLKTVPSIADLNGKYRELYYQYMLKLHTELMRKGFRIMKEEYPEAEFWICSGNLTAAPPHYSRWACIDVRTIDDLVDKHFNMPYYTGPQFFDDVDYNVKHLKKPNFIIHYPSYVKPSYNYTPKRLLQNVVASAAVGCIGAGFGESDILSGESQTVLARAFSMISRAEKYYFHGKRCDGEISVIPKNAISRKLSNGKTITSPDFSQVVRYTAHKLNSKYLITVLNYHQKLPLIAEISGRDFKPVLVKVGPEGCEQVGTDLIPPQEPLRREIAAYSGGNAFKDYAAGENKAVWTASSSGKALIQLSDGKIFAGVDSLESGEVVSLQNAAGKELLTDGFIGRIMFKDKLQPKLNWKTERYGLEKDNTPFLAASASVGAYESAIPDPNPLLGMKIRREFRVKDGKLSVAFEFTNPTEKEMPFQLRLNNFPWPGFRFKTKNIVFNGKYDAGSPLEVTVPDTGMTQSLKAQGDGLSDEILFRPKTKFTNLLSWSCPGNNNRKTVEFVFERKLAPGATLKAEYEVWIK